VLRGPQGALEWVGIFWNPLVFQKIRLVVSGYATTLQGTGYSVARKINIYYKQLYVNKKIREASASDKKSS